MICIVAEGVKRTLTSVSMARSTEHQKRLCRESNTSLHACLYLLQSPGWGESCDSLLLLHWMEWLQMNRDILDKDSVTGYHWWRCSVAVWGCDSQYRGRLLGCPHLSHWRWGQCTRCQDPPPSHPGRREGSRRGGWSQGRSQHSITSPTGGSSPVQILVY